MQKATVLVLLSLCSAFAFAQAPANKNKTAVSKTAVKPKMSASEEATAAAQAAAIAQAAGQQSTAAAVGQSSGHSPVSAPLNLPLSAPASTHLAASVATKAQPGTAVTSAATAAAPLVLAPAQAGVPHDAVSAEELAIAKRVHQGHLPCELGTSIRVEHDAAQPGYFHLQGKGFRYRMRPVVTSTGAIRLEDAKAGAVWLQLANKSMLMDQKKGRRVADECAHPEQLAYAESMKTNPPPKLFDTTGMGR